MYKKIIFVSLLLLLMSCQTEEKQKDDKTTDANESYEGAKSAKDALNYTGVYEGKFPCADCDYILYKVSINEDQSFYAKYVYVGKSDETFVEEGKYFWSGEGDNIILKSKKQKTQFKVGENKLQMLTQGGKEIESDFKEKYILKKVN